MSLSFQAIGQAIWWLLFYLPLALAAGSCLYHLAVTLAALRFVGEREPHADSLPPISVLKPLRGIEPNFYATLRTFFEQDYPSYEIIFGIADSSDPAHETVAQLRRDFPRRLVKVVAAPVDSNAPGYSNPKLNSLRWMLPEAAHDLIFISDADIRVEPDYLRNVVQPLLDQRVGLVTCLYRGVCAARLSSVFEALAMSADFAGQVLLARMLGGMRFAMGATMATRKSEIERIGGLAPWADYLADDFVLGNRLSAAGREVRLSHTVVETMLPARTWTGYWRQQVRWARTVRVCSPQGYPGLLLAYSAPLSLLPVVLLPGSPLALGVMICALLARWLAAWAAGVHACRDKLVGKYFWLLPLRDLAALAIWLAGLFGSEVVWREARFRLEHGGKIRPAGSD